MSGQLASIPFERGEAGTRATSNVPHFPRFAPSLSYASLTMPSDPFEREADRLSGDAMRREPAPGPSHCPALLRHPYSPIRGADRISLKFPPAWIVLLPGRAVRCLRA